MTVENELILIGELGYRMTNHAMKRRMKDILSVKHYYTLIAIQEKAQKK
ncbi:hypothetical protein [Halalkalibacter urbisdiaboli]|nr:hypothetical protein [Halalkalibacter urbisdiaboli]